MPVPRAPLWERVSKISYCWLEFLEFLHDLLIATSISKLVRTLRPCSSRRTACTSLGDVQVRELGCEQIRVDGPSWSSGGCTRLRQRQRWLEIIAMPMLSGWESEDITFGRRITKANRRSKS